MKRWPLVPWRALLLAMLLILLLPAAAPPPPDGGHGAFLKAQAEIAKKALRSRDYDGSESAWMAVLELDPSNLAALGGLVEVSAKRKDDDAEALYLRELNALLAVRVAGGEGKRQRELDKSAERLAELDPLATDGPALVAAHSDTMAELGRGYLERGFHANALTCWNACLSSLARGQESERAEALAAMARCLAEGGDHVAKLGLSPDLSSGGKDEEWIAEFDGKTVKFSKAGEWQTPHYRFRVAGNYRLGQAASQAMEQVADFYREVWGIVPDPPRGKPHPDLRDINITPIAVNIYATHAEYVKKTGSPEWSGGVFMGSEVATYDHGSNGSWRGTLSTLFHEASHQFMAEAVGNPPSYVNEGIACQFESIEILPNGSIRRDAPAKHYLRDLVKILRTQPDFTLAKVMDPKEGNHPDFYAPRWGLFHYLRMAVDEQGGYVYREQFDDYLYAFKKGTPGNPVEHFEEFFITPIQRPGITDFASFEAVWRQWMLDLDAALRGRDKRLDEYRGKARMASLRDEHAVALAFWERCFDLEPDEPEVLAGLASAAEALGDADRAVWLLRRWMEVTEPEDKDRKAFEAKVMALDPLSGERDAARRDLVGGMAGLAQQHDRAGRPLLAMRVAHDVLEIDPYDPAARALVARLERESGRSVVRWQRLFNGIDLTGWFGGGDGSGAFLVRDGTLTSDYGRVVDPDAPPEEVGASLYQTLFVERSFAGDWTMEARIGTSANWEIAGLCFGARDNEHFEGVVLRCGSDGSNRVDFGSFDGAWSFRGGGSYKADYDPTAPGGTLLRVDVRDRHVSVTIDGVPLAVTLDGKPATSIQYPRVALAGDAGLLASKGVTTFRDIRLLAGRTR